MILASWPYAQRNFKKEALKDIHTATGIKLVLPDRAWLLLPTERQGLSVESAANFRGLFIVVKRIWWHLIQINCTRSYLPVPHFLFVCNYGEMDCHVVSILHLEIDQISFHSSLTMNNWIILEIIIGIMCRIKQGRQS